MSALGHHVQESLVRLGQPSLPIVGEAAGKVLNGAVIVVPFLNRALLARHLILGHERPCRGKVAAVRRRR